MLNGVTTKFMMDKKEVLIGSESIFTGLQNRRGGHSFFLGQYIYGKNGKENTYNFNVFKICFFSPVQNNIFNSLNNEKKTVFKIRIFCFQILSLAISSNLLAVV